MSRHIVVIDGHPDADPARLGHALADAYAAGAAAAGHGVARVDLASLAIPLLHSAAEFRTAALPPDLVAAVAAMSAADHMVLVFPLWLGTMPALVKAFLEQSFRPGTAFRYEADGSTTMLWTGKSARLVVTMGMPALAYRWWYGAHGVRGLERNILSFVGIRPVRRTLYGSIDSASPATRAGWLAEMERLGRAGA